MSTVCFSDDSTQASLSNAYSFSHCYPRDLELIIWALWCSHVLPLCSRMVCPCSHSSTLLAKCLHLSFLLPSLSHIAHARLISREQVDNRHPDTTRARASSRVSESSGVARLQCSGAWRHKRYSRASLSSHEQVERHGTPPCLSINN